MKTMLMITTVMSFYIFKVLDKGLNSMLYWSTRWFKGQVEYSWELLFCLKPDICGVL